MDKLLFGTAGTPNSTPVPPSSIAGIARIAELGLGCMELEFVRGVHMGKETALQVAETAKRLDLKLTAHAPYFINLHSSDPVKIEASRYHILQTARTASLCGAASIVFHAGVYEGDTPENVYAVIKKNFEDVLKQVRREKISLWIRPEVMGKCGQFGTLEELFNLSNEFEGVLPTIDFAHWHARTGKYNTYKEFAEVLETMEKKLGRRALDNMHMHISGIKYGAKGELKHLNFDESDFNYRDLVKALKDHEAKGFAICESPNLETDAVVLRDTYNSL